MKETQDRLIREIKESKRREKDDVKKAKVERATKQAEEEKEQNDFGSKFLQVRSKEFV